jgi:hypothetical protein
MGGTVAALMGSTIATAALVAATAVAALGAALVKVTLDAIPLQNIELTFDRLAGSIGETSEAMVVGMRAATRGMIRDADLMAASNKFVAMGLASSADEAARLAEMATQLGMAMGQDATKSMENFALLMANQSLPRLDEFGISSGRVRQRIEQLQAAMKGMTYEAAFNQAVMEEGTKTMARVGEQGEGAAGKMARLQAQFANIKDELGKSFLPVAEKVLQWAFDMVQKAMPKITAFFDRLNYLFKDDFRMLKWHFQNNLQWIRLKFEYYWGMLPVWARVGWYKLKQFILTKWDEIKEDSRRRLDTFVATVTEKWDQLKDQGEEWVEGIRQGIQRKWEQFKNWVMEKLRGLEKAIRDFFGWHSPAKMFVDLGADMMRGLARGIEEAAMAPAKAMRRAVLSVTREATGEGYRPEGWGTGPGYGQMAFASNTWSGAGMGNRPVESGIGGTQGVDSARGLMEELQGMMG